MSRQYIHIILSPNDKNYGVTCQHKLNGGKCPFPGFANGYTSNCNKNNTDLITCLSHYFMINGHKVEEGGPTKKRGNKRNKTYNELSFLEKAKFTLSRHYTKDILNGNIPELPANLMLTFDKDYDYSNNIVSASFYGSKETIIYYENLTLKDAKVAVHYLIKTYPSIVGSFLGYAKGELWHDDSAYKKDEYWLHYDLTEGNIHNKDKTIQAQMRLTLLYWKLLFPFVRVQSQKNLHSIIGDDAYSNYCLFLINVLTGLLLEEQANNMLPIQFELPSGEKYDKINEHFRTLLGVLIGEYFCSITFCIFRDMMISCHLILYYIIFLLCL